MSRRLRLSRPLYEALPWLYLACGVGALVASYLHPSHSASLAVGLVGFICLLGGGVVLLRRRDYRALRSQYGDPDSLGDRR
ncbi:MAG TPA: hypothetical protein VJQ47_16465, partial [Steroidobacteraceae bacterium]|nr:hypothetical protein [Steroidobacteraceae bacterium]